MASPTTGKHAGSGTARPVVPEPSFAERARTLVYLSRVGSLSTHSRKQPGFRFGSVMPYALDGHGNPIFFISTMAMHTQNLLADPRASLLVTQTDAGGDPLGASRVTLIGNVLPVPEEASMGRVDRRNIPRRGPSPSPQSHPRSKRPPRSSDETRNRQSPPSIC
jgi:hypothetical protein